MPLATSRLNYKYQELMVGFLLSVSYCTMLTLSHLVSMFVMNLVCKNNIEFPNFLVDKVGSRKRSRHEMIRSGV